MILAQNPESELAIQVIVMAVFGVICAAVASGRGRSGVAWFFVGFLFVCLGLVVLLALPDVKKEEERHKRQAQENRRLREQIKKERQVADGRHGGVERRLRAHDVALDLDTGGAASLEPGTAPYGIRPTSCGGSRRTAHTSPIIRTARVATIPAL